MGISNIFCSATCTIAFAIGWLACCSSDAAKRYKSSSEYTALCGCHKAEISSSPFVSVPVLSSTTVSTWAVPSIAAASLNHTPALTALPKPTIMDAGVANPKAQGQAITSTDTA